ncbi:hypothetical protein EYV94_10385 [Puteibacter caeruleilacunae]|nr:hypothetical protein EYV94_10385 [Puteibacter caeruleilacunae]
MMEYVRFKRRLLTTIIAMSFLFTYNLTWAEGKENKEIMPAQPLSDSFNKEAANQLLKKGIKELVFIKRKTLNGNHIYTEYVNSTWKPGGNICVLNLKTNEVREIVPELNGGVFNRFDISFDAKKIVFDYKASNEEGYRIYEVNVDGTGLQQLTFPQDDEMELVKLYKVGNYHHGTDDLHPCYLPDGGIAFVSTRCQYSVLCASGDQFSTKVLYRMDGDGKNMRPLSNNSVSEASPTVLPDGRILYHRWEYIDKAAGNAKCLWAIRPDGSVSDEIFGNTLTQPECLIYGRTIPGAPNKVVALATSHCCPNNAMGSVVTIEMGMNIRTRDPLNYVTKDVDARSHNGFFFLIDGKWTRDNTGKPGRLFKDPYPISEDLFVVSHKPKGYTWDDEAAYDLCLLNDAGETTPLLSYKDISCWHAYPLIKRKKPGVPMSPVNEKLAAENKAECTVADVYVGLPNVKRGTIKYLRILEQVSRPWAARNRWRGDAGGHAHTVLGIGRLGLKVQHGIVPVEKDGSAYFEVPAGKNIFFQALDENYMAVQTERTFVNYMPGERRSCVGCHETPDKAPDVSRHKISLALKRKPSKPQPQPGDRAAKKVFDYTAQIQPILDNHCIKCHGNKEPKGGLTLTGDLTKLYSKSYENLFKLENGFGVPYAGDWRNGNEDIGSDDISFRKEYRTGSYTSPLVTVISNGDITINNPNAEAITERLREAHKDVQLSEGEFVTIVNWLDCFGQFYPSYWGLKNEGYKDHKYFRPTVTFDEAISRQIPKKLLELYSNPPSPFKKTAKKN